MKIGIIGAGNMGSAFYKGLLKQFAAEDLYVCDNDRKKLDALNCSNVSTDVGEILANVDVAIFAIKPQSFKEFEWSMEEKLVISIMAGISIDTLRDKTGAGKIVRSMPNLPVQVGHGLTGWIATEAVTEKNLIKKIFGSLGEEIEVTDESMIDSITALSGSGPAYFFYLCETISKKAEALGFSSEEARKIAESTFVGSAFLLDANTKSAGEWREAVTSKGGTTEAALNHLESASDIIAEAIEKAKNRSKELNQ